MNRLYQTRRRSKPDASRVNWRKTRVSLTSCLDDSESETSTPSTSSESEFENDQSEEESPPEVAVDHKPNREGSDAEEVCAVPQSRRKRFSTTILTESSSDSDSDVGGRPVRKLLPKKRQNLQLSDSEAEAAAKQDAEKKAAEVKETAAKRRDRRNKLLELSKKRRSRTSRSRRRKLEGSSEAECHSNDGNDDEKEECTSYQEVHSSEEEEGDKDSLKDFIVESDDQKGGEGSSVQGAEGSLLSHHLPQFVPGSMLTHFQVVVKAFLINALDESFLKSLYDGERTKKYALEMKNSLYHLEQRCILPRLENLKQRSRWSDRYKERVECYPKARVMMTGVRERSCQACELHRNCRFTVQLSGQLYDNRTLKQDEFMPDDTQAFQVGNVCARRTEVYHQLKHFKYHLFCRCQAVLKEEERGGEEDEEEPVKDTVVRVLTKLQTSGWITEQYEKLQDYLNDADYFQEEKLD
ncbi:coiled-coil domain-containing protein 82 [Anguilla anguilla]|uniref:DUF4211 domain-containing protein n=1 Tax=Anguilla anguilla TaxID=7936 RepID=A0A9D3RU81_ANGAN|nr:coiled-coil domain-containing protein 82 [Anguilla anguilla]KAG5843689.1 hypothetical protein ANANG_G00153580 [Anguilla anguilla]